MTTLIQSWVTSLFIDFYEERQAGVESLMLWESSVSRHEFIHTKDVVDACIVWFVDNTIKLILPLNLGLAEMLLFCRPQKLLPA